MKVPVLTGVAFLAAAVSVAVLSAQTAPGQQGPAQTPSDQQDWAHTPPCDFSGDGAKVTGQHGDPFGPPTDGMGGYGKLWKSGWCTGQPFHTTVLPKDATVEQLSNTMLDWREAIADEGHCTTCHSNSKTILVRPGGEPEIDPYDDSKQQYKVAQRMYLLTQELNKTYFPMTKEPITCGTCHRGHLIPQAYEPLPLPGHPGAPTPPGAAPAPPVGIATPAARPAQARPNVQ